MLTRPRLCGKACGQLLRFCNRGSAPKLPIRRRLDFDLKLTRLRFPEVLAEQFVREREPSVPGAGTLSTHLLPNLRDP